jgi:hypothetical protein
MSLKITEPVVVPGRGGRDMQNTMPEGTRGQVGLKRVRRCRWPHRVDVTVAELVLQAWTSRRPRTETSAAGLGYRDSVAAVGAQSSGKRGDWGAALATSMKQPVCADCSMLTMVSSTW